MRVLPDNLRNLLKTPVGQLVNEEQLLKILIDKDKIVTIGDQVTYTILKNGINPIFCIVDFKTRRGKCSSDVINVLKSYGDKCINVNNPAGALSDELWNAVKYAYENFTSENIRIEVDGEEDLAALAVLYLAPSEDVTVIYGLPDKGVLVVKADQDIKRKVKEVFDKM